MAEEEKDKARIYIIEDEALVARELKTCLIGLVYDVVGMAFGAAGLMPAVDARSDLLLTDINLKDGDGIELAVEIATLASASCFPHGLFRSRNGRAGKAGGAVWLHRQARPEPRARDYGRNRALQVHDGTRTQANAGAAFERADVHWGRACVCR